MASKSTGVRLESSLLEVLGTDAAGLGGRSRHWLDGILRADLVAAPRRLLPDLEAHGAGATAPELIASGQPGELLARLAWAMVEGRPDITIPLTICT